MPAITGVRSFVVDYCQRHAHPMNAFLHILGVPMAFYGVYELFTGALGFGLIALFFGYFLQFLGHRAQGNEVGEVTLIKTIWSKTAGRQRT